MGDDRAHLRGCHLTLVKLLQKPTGDINLPIWSRQTVDRINLIDIHMQPLEIERMSKPHEVLVQSGIIQGFGLRGQGAFCLGDGHQVAHQPHDHRKSYG